jgi:hypothetical protein
MIRKIIATLGVAGAALLGAMVPASAQTQAAPNCQFGSSYGTEVARAAVLSVPDDIRVGTVEVCRDSAFKYWGFVIYDVPMTASQYAEAWLNAYRDGQWVSQVKCSQTDPDDNVRPGQTRCWTPKVGGVSGHYTFSAYTEKYSSHSSALLASGGTVRDR